MPYTADHKKYNMTIRYFSNIKSGTFQITIDYESPEGAGALQHGQTHFRMLTTLLEKAGVLRGDCCVRIRRAGLEEVYRVSRSKRTEPWRWELESQQGSGLSPTADPKEPDPVDPESPVNEPN